MNLLLFALLIGSRADTVSPSPADVVHALYKEVIRRHPLGLWSGEDKAAIWPLLSPRLKQSLDDLQACEDNYYEANRARYTPEEAAQLKSEVGWLEYGLFSGGNEQALPAEVEVTQLVPARGGTFDVHVLFTYRDTFKTYGRPPDDRNTFQWRGVVTIVKEGRRFTIDNVRLMDSETGKLEPGLPEMFAECKGRQWIGGE
jgi:hypothetical protein